MGKLNSWPEQWYRLPQAKPDFGERVQPIRCQIAEHQDLVIKSQQVWESF